MGRDQCSNWCNIRDAGVGHFPTTNTGHSKIDAFLRLKTPGESDGCTEILPDGTNCPRFDTMCASDDSLGSSSGEPRALKQVTGLTIRLSSLLRMLISTE